MKCIFLGPPGVGKGTQAQLVSRDFGYPQISTGDILRDAIRGESELGKSANEYMQKGELVPDDLMLGIIRDRLFGNSPLESFILDGFPRTLPQAEGLEALFRENGSEIDIVLLFDADAGEIVPRLSARRSCKRCNAVYNLISKPPRRDGICDRCGGELFQRDDDREETIRKRLQVYEEQTRPLIDFYQKCGKLHRIVAEGSPRKVYQQTQRILGG